MRSLQVSSSLVATVSDNFFSLAQLEQHPQAFGLASAARPAIRRLRRQRNRALHGNRVSDRMAEIETRVMDSEKGISAGKGCRGSWSQLFAGAFFCDQVVHVLPHCGPPQSDRNNISVHILLLWTPHKS